MRILIIDNNIDRHSWGASNLVRFATRETGATVSVRRGPHDDLPASIRSFDRLVISGSRTSCLDTLPWITRLEKLIREAVDAGTPVLGVCFGHQILARTLGDGERSVRKGRVPEFGWTRIEQTAPSPLFEGLPDSFHSFSSHFEEVTDLPRGFRLLARSHDCAIQAMQLGQRPVYGIQFHPEKNETEAQEIFDERTRKGEGRSLMHAGRTRACFNPEVGLKIFTNFYASGTRA